MNSSTHRRSAARTAALAALLCTTGGLMAVGAGPAAASGCTTPPCGALTNHTRSDRIGVKWTDNNTDWKYGIVEPNTTMGGYWNDGIDVDFWYIPSGCTDRGGIGGTSHTWSGGSNGTWAKISSTQTVVINSRTC